MGKKAKQLIIISFVINTGTLLSGSFVSIFLWKITESIQSVARYNLVLFAIYAVVFPVFSWVSKRYSVTLVLRISLVFQILYFGSIIFMGQQAAGYLWLLSILSGIAAAANANSQNQLTIENTQPENRSIFVSYSGMLNSIAAMFSPLLSGFIIVLFPDMLGYYVMFFGSMALFIVAFFLVNWFSGKGSSASFTFFRSFYRSTKQLPGFYAGQFTVGVRDGIFGFLISILLFDVIQTESLFGAASALFKLVAIVCYFFGVRFIRRSNLWVHLRYSMWIMFAAPIPLFLFQNQFGVIGQMGLDAVASPLVAITLNSLIMNIIEGSAKQHNNLEELLAVKEVWLHLGKVAGVLMFILLEPVISRPAMYIIMLVTNLCYVFSYVMYKQIDIKNTQ